MASKYERDRERFEENFELTEDGQYRLSSSVIGFKELDTERIVGYTRCIKCGARVGYTELDDPDELIRSHC